jgi:methylated-DNA-[protein]-cysteine S-methyltransferase
MSGPGSHYRLPAGSAWGDIDSPVGPLGAVVTPHGLLRLTFGPLASFADELATAAADTDRGADPGADSSPADAGRTPSARPAPLAQHEIGALISRELKAYFAGTLTEFTVPVDWSLTSGVQRSILSTLHARIRYGDTVGYGDLALLSGRTLGASRLVGTVMGSNPIVIVVPCHRVIAADGGIGGFGGGLETKRRLLTLEGSLQPTLF